MVLGLIVTGGYLLLRTAKPKDFGMMFATRRGPLDITVLIGGSIESEEKGEIKCEVKGGGQGVKILKIVEEGYQVSENDVKTNKILVELDSADLRNKITQQEITFQSTAASLTDAQQAYDIQLNQNLSDVKAAEQKAFFARLDFDKYMGDQAAGEIIDQLGLKTELAAAGPLSTNQMGINVPGQTPVSREQEGSLGQAPAAGPSATNALADNSLSQCAAPVLTNALVALTNGPAGTTNLLSNTNSPLNAALSAINFSKYADLERLGDGEAKQKLRELQDAVQIAQKEMQQAQSTLAGTKRLFDKDFVTKIDMDRDQIAYENSVLKRQKAETALHLFQKYEFRKSAQETLSKYTESLRELDRTHKGAVSKLAQADAKLKSAQARYSVDERQLKELKDQLDKCFIKARRPGLVVYGSGGEVRYWRDEEQIREGATVREGQTVLTVPDLRKMCIKVKIHEAYIKQIKKGQPARITADAFPDRKLEGEVSQVGVLPDSENSWLNPDMKVYRTTVTIKGTNDWIRPGMSTKVQILVNQLSNVVYAPIQAVGVRKDKKVCYLVARGKMTPCEVELGEFNDEFIEIKKGLKEGDKICLRKPSSLADEGSGKAKPKDSGTPEKTKEGQPAAKAAVGGS